MNNYEIVKFVDGDFQLNVRTDKENETVWLTLDEIGEVFGRDRSVIGKHIKNILNNSELDEKSVSVYFG